MSVLATTENGLRAGDAPFEMGTVSALGIADTARASWRRPRKNKGRD